MNKLFVGIDVGSRINAVYIMLPDGSKHSSFTVQNNLGGAQSLSKRVVAALNEYNISTVILGMEATSVYGDNLACFLREELIPTCLRTTLLTLLLSLTISALVGSTLQYT